MARIKSISAIDAEISKVNDELAKLKAKEDALLEQLTKLQEKKQTAEAKQVMEAFKKSGKSLQELMTFLEV